jgi:hypothetical protein
MYGIAIIHVNRLVEVILAEMARPEEPPEEQPLGFGQTDAAGILCLLRDWLYPHDTIDDSSRASEGFSSEPEGLAEDCMQESVHEEAFADADTQISCIQAPPGLSLIKDQHLLGIDACVRSGCVPVADIFRGIPAYEDYTSELKRHTTQIPPLSEEYLSLSYSSLRSSPLPSQPVKKRSWECAFHSVDLEDAVNSFSAPSFSMDCAAPQHSFIFGSCSANTGFDFVPPSSLEEFDKDKRKVMRTDAKELENAPKPQRKQTKRKDGQKISKKRKANPTAWSTQMPAPIRLVTKDVAPCPYPGCDVIFNCHVTDIPDVTTHLHKEHSLATWETDANGGMTCPVVGCENLFVKPKTNRADRAKNIGRHMVTVHMGFLLFKCPNCNIKGFDRDDAAKRHIANTPCYQRPRKRAK